MIDSVPFPECKVELMDMRGHLSVWHRTQSFVGDKHQKFSSSSLTQEE